MFKYGIILVSIGILAVMFLPGILNIGLLPVFVGLCMVIADE